MSIFNTISRMVVRRAVGRGMNAGIDKTMGPGRRGADAPLTPEERRQRQRARKQAKTAKKAARVARRFIKF
ncbi:hypothetical protein [Salipiger mucosus]|uniref:Uncharacterized protein n=1 Tax=Salipiger mucosus DSM 16094 TaxID=1123237 RepID=S9S0B0_9RHOB|nr:hypothetical protein [Salipiger mucosus]EPX83645.1 hypothetical protein Salmuc_02254 [Salipiger mucosus DSM 16094]